MESTEMILDVKTQEKSAEQLQVAIVGEINPDLIFYGLPRELPEEREILATGFHFTLGSSSAIFAHNLALLGNKVIFNSRIGSDQFGEMCCQRLREAGVEVDRVVRSDSGTGTGITVVLPLPTGRRILTYPGSMFELAIEDLNIDYLATASHFHLSSIFLHRKLSPDIPLLFREMKRRGLTTSLDTNDDPENRWEGVLGDVLESVDLLLCTEEEVARIAKVQAPEEYLSRKIPVLVVKCGERGARAYSNGRRIDVPALQVDVIDSVGAGDSFDAGFLHQWIRKAPLETCVAYGHLAGGLSVTRPGGIEAFRDFSYRQSFFEKHWRQDTLVR